MIQILLLPHLILYLQKGNYHPGSLSMISWGPLKSQKFALGCPESLWGFPKHHHNMRVNWGKDGCFTGVKLLELFNAYWMSFGGFSSPALPFRRTKVSSSGSQSSRIVATGFWATGHGQRKAHTFWNILENSKNWKTSNCKFFAIRERIFKAPL